MPNSSWKISAKTTVELRKKWFEVETNCYFQVSKSWIRSRARLEWKYSLDLAFTILRTNGNVEEDCGKSVINRSVTATGQVPFPILAKKAVWPYWDITK